MSEGVEVIREGAIAYLGLESITISNSVLLIGIDAFYGCEDLKTVSMSNKPQRCESLNLGENTLYILYFLSFFALPNLKPYNQ